MSSAQATGGELSEQAGSPGRGWLWGVAALVALHLGFGIHTALSKSVTHDELWHLPVGIQNWNDWRFDHDDLNPPLTRMWAALPAKLAGVEATPGNDAPQTALRFVLEHEDYRRWYVAGRLMNLLLSAATACLLAAWARRWFGKSAAVITTAVYCTSPNVLAHSSIVTPDAGLTLGFVATLFVLNLWLESRSWRFALLLGAALGVSQATKFTAVLLYPLVGILWLFSARGGAAAKLRGWQLPVALALSLCFWNAAYLFQGTGRSLADYNLQSSALSGIKAAFDGLARLPVPLPREYMTGLDRQRAVMEQPHPSYLDGVWSVTGFPSYFLRTLQYKLPHPFQVFAIWGTIVLASSRGVWQRWRKLLTLWLPGALLVGIASFSSMQLGVRYVLPALPLLMLCAGAIGVVIDRCPRRVRITGVSSAALLCLTSLRHHPHHLAYFNELAGGPVGGRHHLLDSNLDWGQDLNLVKAFMEDHDLEEIGLAYFGTLPCEALGIRYHIPPGRAPEPGWYAVSVNYVMGRPHLLREPDGSSRPVDLNEFAYFQAFEPVARLGYSIDVYHLSEADIAAAGRRAISDQFSAAFTSDF
jgi:4-amino-4-deoxy-L-arabinose transferase-like glycosyltransferase